MSTLSQEDVSILLCYFQYKIKQNKIIMQLKDEYKKEKPIPLRTLKNGKKIPLCGEKYYCYYFGDTNGKQIFSARKKLFSIFSLIEFCINNLNLDNKTIYDLNKLNSELKSKVSDKLSEFYTSIKPIKQIEVLNFLYFNESGQLDIGTSAHASFNTDAVENSQMICFCSPSATSTKIFEQRRNSVGFNLWFLDYKGQIINQIDNPNHWFVLELNLIY